MNSSHQLHIGSKGPHRSIGVIHNRYYNFSKFRNEYFSNARLFPPSNENDSCFDENGKTRYFKIYIISLLGEKKKKERKNSIELATVNSDNLYIDIFNSTKLLYEELNQKCIFHLIIF